MTSLVELLEQNCSSEALIAEIESRLSALETEREVEAETCHIDGIDYRIPSLAELFEMVMQLNAGLSSHIKGNIEILKELKVSIPATPQPVRIRPEDMVMVYRDDLSEPEKVKLSRINWECTHITHISPIQPVKARKWMRQDSIVWMRRDTGQIEKGTVFSAVKNCYPFTPVLSPDEPAPEGPSEVGR